MALAAFDINNKLHNDLFQNFKNDLISDIYTKDHLYCQNDDYIDEMNLVLRDIAVNELRLDTDLTEFDSFWSVAIFNPNPTTFGIIAGIEYFDFETDTDKIEFFKVEGEIVIEDEALIILDLDSTTADYSTRQEFEQARQTYLNI